MDNNINKKLLDNNNNNTENDKEDILATFRKIVASAQFIGNYNNQQQQNQINYFEDIKGNQIEEIQKNNFKQCREKRKFTSEVSDFLVIEVLKRKTLLVENNTSRDLTFSEKKRNAWNDVRLLLSTRFVGFDQNIEAIKSHWRYRKRKVTDIFGEFNFSINHENKLKEKLTPIDLKIYEELRDSNMLQDSSMDIDNTSISETSDETSPTTNNNLLNQNEDSPIYLNQKFPELTKPTNLINQNLNSSSLNNNQSPSTNNLQFILTQLIAKKYVQQLQNSKLTDVNLENKNKEKNHLFDNNNNRNTEHSPIEENSNLNEENEKIQETFEKMRGKKRHYKVEEEEFVKEKEDSPINSKVDEEPIESLQRKALIAQISAFNEFKNSAQIVCNTAMELQELLPQLAEFLSKALNK
uniref:Regulatory protein zeste n=1 Tax=Meloidogyne floridensis TaxID=298350 RepID=A0A915NMI2_9BILA